MRIIIYNNMYIFIIIFYNNNYIVHQFVDIKIIKYNYIFLKKKK